MESPERRSVVGYSPWGRRESDTTERLHFLSFMEVSKCLANASKVRLREERE